VPKRRLRLLYAIAPPLYPIFACPFRYSRHGFNSEDHMDIVFLAAGALLWGVMVLLVAGFRRLESPQGGR
jgi:hypothetical protein